MKPSLPTTEEMRAIAKQKDTKHYEIMKRLDNLNLLLERTWKIALVAATAIIAILIFK